MYENLRNDQGAIVFLVHGLSGDETTYDSFVNIIQTSFPFLDYKVYKTSFLSIKNLNSNSILSDISDNKNNYINKKVFIEVSFEHQVVGYIADQAHELKIMIDEVKRSLGDYAKNYKFLLFGHSKGGLVSLRYALNYPNTIDGVICINSPLNGALYGATMGWSFTGGFSESGNETVFSEIKTLINDWNSKEKDEVVNVICLATEINNSGDDGVVPNLSALGYGTTIFPELNIEYKNIYYRLKLSGSSDYYGHTGDKCLANYSVVYQIILLMVKLLNSCNFLYYDYN